MNGLFVSQDSLRTSELDLVLDDARMKDIL